MIRFMLILLGLLVLFMIAGGIPIEGGAQTTVFRTPAFIALLVTLCALLILGCARYGRGLRRAVFWPAHLGIVLILLGAGLGFLSGVSGHLAMPMGSWHMADRLPAGQGDSIPLGFGLSVRDFDVKHYDPTYLLYHPKTDEARKAEDYSLVTELALTVDGVLPIEGYGEVPRSELWDVAASAWVPQLSLTNGWVLQRGRETPKEYTATLDIRKGRETETRVLKVNKPVTVNDWRIYLVSYEMHPRQYVQVFLRRDPGRRVVIAGIWLVIVGTTLLCWRRRGSCKAPEKPTHTHE